jgi:hypothetical protein
MDFTVSTPAIISRVYDQLPANGSELVLFDVNRTVKFGPLLRTSASTALDRLLPPAKRAYQVTVVTNADPDTNEVVARSTEAGTIQEQRRTLGIAYPPGLYSLSHVALPFPVTDALYGMTPNEPDSFGPNLGALTPRGERNVLITSLDALLRVASNPFFPYLAERIQQDIDNPPLKTPQTNSGTVTPEGDRSTAPAVDNVAPPWISDPTQDDADLPP